MFDKILTSFQGFFSRSFWLGSFLPVGVIATLHLVIVNIAFPGLVPIAEWLDAGFTDTATGLSLMIVGLVVLAYALTPFTPLVRGFLDGRLMPDWLHDLLRQDRMSGWRTAHERIRSATDEHGRFAQMKTVDIQRLWDASKAGDKLAGITDRVLIEKARSAVESWRNEIERGRLPGADIVQAATDGLNDALLRNASNLTPPHADAALSQQLASVKEELIDLISEASNEAQYRFTRMAYRYYRLDLYPTRAGDARWAAERYSADAYRVDFDFIWSRIQLLLKKDENVEFLQRLTDTRSQVDSTVLTLALTLTVPLVWLPTLLFTATTPWLFLAIGLVSPVVLSFLYESVVQSQMVFGEVVRVAIDKYRLDVLTKIMRQPLPATLGAERLLWQGLRSASEPGNEADLSYRHPTT